MKSVEEKTQCVFFADNYTIEEEYKIMNSSVTKSRNLPVSRVEGNYLLPRVKEYNNKIHTYPIVPASERHLVLENIIYSLLSCEPFYNLLSTFKDRTKYRPEMVLFNNIYYITATYRNEYTDPAHVERLKEELEKIFNEIDNLINEKDAKEIYKKILMVLHEEFLKGFFYTYMGWETTGKDIYIKEKNFFKEYSPISELFIGEIKKIGESIQTLEFFDSLSFNGRFIKEGIDEIIASKIHRDIKEISFNNMPMILTIFGDDIKSEQEIKIKNHIYILKNIIDKNGSIVKESNECKVLFYTKKNIGN
ncbi:hypothetical protein GVAV_001472 [Gurleya vavrai]